MKQIKFFLLFLVGLNTFSCAEETWVTVVALDDVPVYSVIDGTGKEEIFIVKNGSHCKLGSATYGKVYENVKIKCAIGEGWIVSKRKFKAITSSVQDKEMGK